MAVNVIFVIILSNVLMKTVVYSLTFINVEYSHVRLKRESWYPNTSLHFKIMSNVDDGTILTATNQNNQQLKLHLKQLKFKLNIGGEDQKVEGLSNIQLNVRSWFDIEIKQTENILYFIVGEYSTILKLPRRKRRDWLIENWIDIELGANNNTTLPLWKSFIGCIEFPRTHNENGSIEYIQGSRFVLDDCIDACSFMSCKNGGRCINNYKNIICDCRSTGYEGYFCEDKCLAVAFDGLSYMDFVGTMQSEDEKKSEYSLRFKTTFSNGIILSTHYSNESLLVEIYDGSIIVTKLLNTGMLRMLIGRGLDDNKWHHLLVTQYLDGIEISADGVFGAKSINQFLKYEKTQEEIEVFLGGTKNNEILSTSLSGRNFHGCLQAVYINKLSILNSVNTTTFSKHSLHQCNGVT